MGEIGELASKEENDNHKLITNSDLNGMIRIINYVLSYKFIINPRERFIDSVKKKFGTANSKL